jgi:hypothetical protein
VTDTEAALKALMLLGLDGDAPAYRLLLSNWAAGSASISSAACATLPAMWRTWCRRP